VYRGSRTHRPAGMPSWGNAYPDGHVDRERLVVMAIPDDQADPFNLDALAVSDRFRLFGFTRREDYLAYLWVLRVLDRLRAAHVAQAHTDDVAEELAELGAHHDSVPRKRWRSRACDEELYASRRCAKRRGGVVLEWLMQVVATGGSAFVGAAGTDTWQFARSGVVRLFGRGGQRRQDAVGRWADQTAAEIEQAPEAERTLLRERLALTWQQRLGDLVEEYPEVGEEVQAWVRQVQAQLPAAQQTWVNTFVARDHATQYNAPGGSITVTERRDPPSSTP
jgi:hypothetical protein